jgi:RNA polymerase sigma-70 factor (ECF subfamily)
MQDKHESDLILNSRNGDMNAMTELFRRHYSASIGVARNMLPSRDESLDAVQSAYLAAFRKFDSFRGQASFKTWITRIVMNECLMLLRRPVRQRETVSLDHAGPEGRAMLVVDRAPTPEDLARSAEASRSIEALAEKLPKRLREVFLLCELSGLSVREAADALGLTRQATKTRLFRARSRVRVIAASSFPINTTRRNSHRSRTARPAKWNRIAA